MAATHKDAPRKTFLLQGSGPTLTKFAAEYVERRSPSWKPSTVEATNCYLRSAILPALGHLLVGSVVRADVARFFHEYGRRKPGGANRSHAILRNMFDCGIAWGLSDWATRALSESRPRAPSTCDGKYTGFAY